MPRKPSDASHRPETAPDDNLNLSPIMALLVILIPMLLAMFNFFEVKVQAVAAPKLGSGQTKKSDDTKKPLNLTVLISQDGFRLKQQAELADEGAAQSIIRKDTFKLTLRDGDRTISKTVEDYDYPTLYTQLAAKKAGYPDEKTINIAAEMDIPWHVVARTIDATRLKLTGSGFSGPDRMNTYSAAKPEMEPCTEDCNGDKKLDETDIKPVELFSRVVFVVAE